MLQSNSTHSCFSKQQNVGKPDCSLNPKSVRGGFLVPKGMIIPASAMISLLALQTYLKAQPIDDDPAKRIRYLGPFESFDDKSTAPQTQTLGYQRQIFSDRGKKAWEYTFLEGGFEYYLMLLQFNGLQDQYDWIPHDEDNILWGVFAGVDTNNKDTFCGQALTTLYVYDWKDPNNNAVVEYRIHIAPEMGRQLNEDLRVMKSGLDLRKLPAVKEVTITNRTPTGASAGVFTIDLLHASVNLVKVFGATIADTDIIKARLTSTGATLAITSIAVNGAGDKAILTFNTSGTGYVATAPAQIYLASVSTLATEGLKYYEASNPLDIVLT